MSEEHDRFDIPDHLARFEFPLRNFAQSLRRVDPIKIVAIGGASTAGEGDITPYPERLELFLREQFPNRQIEVVNKGVGGEEAPEELSRFDRDVLDETPALTIWQVGTTAVFRKRDYNFDDVRSSIQAGLELLAGLPMDVVLMDPQFVPALIERDGQFAEQMVHFIAQAAESAQVNVFRRFALMRHWNSERKIPFDQLIDPADPNKLSQSEASTEALAQALSRAIARSAVRNDDGVSSETVEHVDQAARPTPSDFAVRSPEKASLWIDDSNARRVSLLFATTRQRSKVPEDCFSGEREADLTHYGTANIHIPQDRRLGEVSLPFELKIFSVTLLKQRTNPRKHFILEHCQMMPKEEWLNVVRSSEQKQALVFVHGFNVTFLEGIYRCAQIAWDIRYDGIPILFSWASRGVLKEYIYDQGSALDARDRFVALLGDLSEAGVTKVHVLAHSMGNYSVLEALAHHNHVSRPLGLGEVLMAAPDVDRDIYAKIAPKVRAVTSGMTLYASAADWAMTAAKEIAGSIPRAGDVPQTGPILVDQVDAIDATAVGTDMFGLNHGTYAEKKSILNDIKLLLTHGIKPPNRRSTEISGMPEGEKVSKWWRYIA